MHGLSRAGQLDTAFDWLRRIWVSLPESLCDTDHKDAKRSLAPFFPATYSPLSLPDLTLDHDHQHAFYLTLFSTESKLALQERRWALRTLEMENTDAAVASWKLQAESIWANVLSGLSSETSSLSAATKVNPVDTIGQMFPSSSPAVSTSALSRVHKPNANSLLLAVPSLSSLYPPISSFLLRVCLDACVACSQPRVADQFLIEFLPNESFVKLIGHDSRYLLRMVSLFSLEGYAVWTKLFDFVTSHFEIYFVFIFLFLSSGNTWKSVNIFYASVNTRFKKKSLPSPGSVLFLPTLMRASCPPLSIP